MNIDEKALDYIERQAGVLSVFRIETMELLNKRANTLVALQLAGGGSLAGFAISITGKAPHCAFVAVLVASGLLFLLAVAGVCLCMFTQSVYPPGNTPDNLLGSAGTSSDLLQLRHAELLSLQVRQSSWADRNNQVGRRLNNLYLATALVPMVATGVAWLAR